jgi:hypothetical protein
VDRNIEIICANSPQAKGRVERMNKTLQDRLVKELRLRAVSTMDAGNAFLPEFMADYNQRFGRVEIHCEGRLLPASPFGKNRCVAQGAIVENKRLGAVLSVMQASQLQRDQARLRSKKVTLREKERIVAAHVAARPSTPSADSALPDGLSEVSSFLERFEAEQKARRKVHNDRAALRRKGLAQGWPPA